MTEENDTVQETLVQIEDEPEDIVYVPPRFRGVELGQYVPRDVLDAVLNGVASLINTGLTKRDVMLLINDRTKHETRRGSYKKVGIRTVEEVFVALERLSNRLQEDEQG